MGDDQENTREILAEKADFNSKVVLVQPITYQGSFDLKGTINEQDGLYTLYLRGFENGRKVNDKRIISCVSRCLNIYDDYDVVMACELIDDNGKELERIVKKYASDWVMDLTEISGFQEEVIRMMGIIQNQNIYKLIHSCIE